MLRVILRFRIISSSFMEPTLAICRWAYVSATTVVVMTTKHQFLQVPHIATLASDMHASVKRIYRALAPSRNGVVILNNENVSFVIVDTVNHDISRLHARYEPIVPFTLWSYRPNSFTVLNCFRQACRSHDMTKPAYCVVHVSIFPCCRRQMPATIEGQITMEKTPSYFITKGVPARIHNMSRNVKLLIVVRDPVTRAISDYTQAVSKRPDLPSFERMAFINDSVGLVDTSWGAIRIGVYAKHLERWLHYFPLEQMHFVSGERLIRYVTHRAIGWRPARRLLIGCRLYLLIGCLGVKGSSTDSGFVRDLEHIRKRIMII